MYNTLSSLKKTTAVSVRQVSMCSFQNFSNKRSYKTPINKQKHAKAAFVLSENEAGQCYSRASREQGELH